MYEDWIPLTVPVSSNKGTAPDDMLSLQKKGHTLIRCLDPGRSHEPDIPDADDCFEEYYTFCDDYTSRIDNPTEFLECMCFILETRLDLDEYNDYVPLATDVGKLIYKAKALLSKTKKLKKRKVEAPEDETAEAEEDEAEEDGN